MINKYKICYSDDYSTSMTCEDMEELSKMVKDYICYRMKKNKEIVVSVSSKKYDTMLHSFDVSLKGTFRLDIDKAVANKKLVTEFIKKIGEI